MIAKEKAVSAAQDKRIQAGNKQESDVAFYLRRAYGDREDVIVLNDLRVSHNGEVAQVDHFIIWTYGFIIIESKSIHGHVKVNKHGEWTRSYKSTWYGIPSPLRQAELQSSLIKALLNHHADNILHPLNLGAVKLPQGFGRRDWRQLCAVSNSCMLERENISDTENDLIYKADSIVDGIEKIIGKRKSGNALLSSFLESKAHFSQQSLCSIRDFLLSQHAEASEMQPVVQNADLDIAATETAQEAAQPIVVDANTKGALETTEASSVHPVHSELLIRCKYCKAEEGLTPKSGRYGYYVTCGECDKNTPMKAQCPACHSKDTKVFKKKDSFTMMCNSCKSNNSIKLKN